MPCAVFPFLPARVLWSFAISPFLSLDGSKDVLIRLAKQFPCKVKVVRDKFPTIEKTLTILNKMDKHIA